MNKLQKIVSLSFAFTALLTTSVAIAATSQNNAGSNIQVTPFLQDLKVNPGDSDKQFSLIINNNSTFEQVFHLAPVNFGSLNESGGLAFEGYNTHKIANQYGLAQWLILDKNDFQLEPNKQTVVSATIQNSGSLSPGAHYAAIITTASKTVQPIGQLTVVPKVSALIFSTKVGGETYNIHLASIAHNGSTWDIPTTVNLRFESTGNTYIIPRGIVYLKQANSIIAKGVINQESSIVLPQATRSFDVQLTKLAPFHRGIIKTNYQIQVDYRYDGINNYARKVNNYNVYTKAIIIIVALIVVIVLAIRMWLKSPAKQKSGKKSRKP